MAKEERKTIWKLPARHRGRRRRRRALERGRLPHLSRRRRRGRGRSRRRRRRTTRARIWTQNKKESQQNTGIIILAPKWTRSRRTGEEDPALGLSTDFWAIAREAGGRLGVAFGFGIGQQVDVGGPEHRPPRPHRVRPEFLGGPPSPRSAQFRCSRHYLEAERTTFRRPEHARRRRRAQHNLNLKSEKQFPSSETTPRCPRHLLHPRPVRQQSADAERPR